MPRGLNVSAKRRDIAKGNIATTETASLYACCNGVKMKRLIYSSLLSVLVLTIGSYVYGGEVITQGSTQSAPAGEEIRYDSQGGALLSKEWVEDFITPPRVWRPLQIVHDCDLTDIARVYDYRDNCGLGGLVVNVGGNPEYIRSDENWKRFVQGVKNLKDAQMRCWIYDEYGYPSLSAGGVVLEGRPDLMALELAYDPEHDPPYYVRDCYEHTHSSNNVFLSRRYPNPLNPEATKRFIDVTHRRYRTELGKENLYDYVEAYFTDEPSMMAANLGEIEGELKSRVADPIDPNKKCLPTVSWGDDVEEKYFEKYGEKLSDSFQSLFSGDSAGDKRVRRQFWSLLGELDGERYYGQIQAFCHENPNGPVASGHTLHEEFPLMHVPLDGNKIEVLKKFDLPGLDLLNSDPHAFFYGCWMATAFPCSAATFIGSRRVMTEVSDFGQLNSGERKPVDLSFMEGTAAWQAAFGVTEFTLYYAIGNAPYRGQECHRNFSRFVGRLNSVLRDAQPVRPVLLYYPIEELQEEYKPVAQKCTMETQSERARQISQSFYDIGAALARAQVSFTVIDRKTLNSLTTTPENQEESERLRGKFSGIIYPISSEVVEYEWADPNFKEFRATAEAPLATWQDVVKTLGSSTGPRLNPTPDFSAIVEGVFEREGRLIFLVSNSYGDPWHGDLIMNGFDNVAFESDEWVSVNPHTGRIETFNATDKIGADLPPRQSLIFISPVLKNKIAF